jgi:hypothetical protein
MHDIVGSTFPLSLALERTGKTPELSSPPSARRPSSHLRVHRNTKGRLPIRAHGAGVAHISVMLNWRKGCA